MKKNILFTAVILIIISFVYTINIQPIVFGSDINYTQTIEKRYDTKRQNNIFNSFYMNNSGFIQQKQYVNKISFEKDFKFTYKLRSIDYNESNRYENTPLYNESYYNNKSSFLNNLVNTLLCKLVKIKILNILENKLY